MKSGKIARRPVVEIVITLLLLVAATAFALFILDNQAAYSDDRIGLMELKESWGIVAGGYRIRGDKKTTSSDFIREYGMFRNRASVRQLVARDAAFAGEADRVDQALYRLEGAEAQGGKDSELIAAKAASQLDLALIQMSGRLADYSRERLDSSRVFLAVLVLIIAFVAVSFLLLERRIMRSSVEEEKSRDLARALLSAQEAERLRISHELHDAVAQDLAAAKLYCGLVAQASRESPGHADAELAVSLLERSIGEVREICQGLRPAELDRLGIAEACAQLCAETGRATGMSILFSAEGFEGYDLEDEIEINIYRIVQEALTNVRRHARAHRVEVKLVARTVSIRLEVQDDGRGPGASSAGLGRRGMEERARMLGGGLELMPVVGGGTRVSAWFPRPGREAL